MFFNALLVGALASFAAAQSAVLTFTNVPNPVTAGNPTALVWATNDTVSAVTITLRQGLASDLQTVQVLTTSAHGNQYIWTPCTALPNGNDYALQIDQGTQTNYYGPFTIQGSTGEGTCSGLVSSSSTSSSARSSSTGLAGNSTITPSLSSTASSAAITGAHNSTSAGASSMPRSSSAGTTSAPSTSSTNGAGFQGTSTTSRGAAATAYAGASFAFLFGAAAVAMA